MKIGPANIAYNIKRYVWLSSRVALGMAAETETTFVTNPEPPDFIPFHARTPVPGFMLCLAPCRTAVIGGAHLLLAQGNLLLDRLRDNPPADTAVSPVYPVGVDAGNISDQPTGLLPGPPGFWERIHASPCAVMC